jgi:hypothetical protein
MRDEGLARRQVEGGGSVWLAVTSHRFLGCFAKGSFRKPAATRREDQSADRSAHSKLCHYLVLTQILTPMRKQQIRIIGDEGVDA